MIRLIYLILILLMIFYLSSYPIIFNETIFVKLFLTYSSKEYDTYQK